MFTTESILVRAPRVPVPMGPHGESLMVTARNSPTVHDNASQLTPRYRLHLCAAGSGTVRRATRVPQDRGSATVTWGGRSLRTTRLHLMSTGPPGCRYLQGRSVADCASRMNPGSWRTGRRPGTTPLVPGRRSPCTPPAEDPTAAGECPRGAPGPPHATSGMNLQPTYHRELTAT
jgi:hypothetical protein